MTTGTEPGLSSPGTSADARPLERLNLERAWYVDPLTGTERPARLTVADGRVVALEWRAAGDDAAAGDDRLLLLPGLIDLSSEADEEITAPAHGGFTRVVSAAEQEALGMVRAHQPLSAGMGEAGAGVPAMILGLRGVPTDAEAEDVRRLLDELRERVAEMGPADAPPLHIAHVSTAASVDLVRAARREGLPVSCDVTVQHICLHDGWLGGDRRFSWQAAASPWIGTPAAAPPYDPATRVDPPLRSPADALALAAAIADGTVQAISSGHAPRDEADLARPYGEVPPGISAVETCLSLVLAAVDAGLLTLVSAVRALTSGPAVIAGFQPGAGLAVGMPADFVLVDRGAEWLVDDRSLQSTARNTSLLGRILPGRVLLTVAVGRTTWLDTDAAQATRDLWSIRL